MQWEWDVLIFMMHVPEIIWIDGRGFRADINM
jgi:hypothetical protein